MIVARIVLCTLLQLCFARTNLATNTATERHFSALGQNLWTGEEMQMSSRKQTVLYTWISCIPSFQWQVLLCIHSALFPQNPTSQNTWISEVFQKTGNSLVIHIRDKGSPISLIISYLVDLDKEQSKAGTLSLFLPVIHC